MKIGIECFAGCNTAVGFFSGFEGLFANKDKTFFIKGAPGTGKSSLMKRIAARQKALGHTVSVFHCSSDPDSLDGVVDETIRASIFDATAPHTYDPPFPGATGTILALGDSLNEEALFLQRREIELLNAEIKAEFSQAAGFLSAVSEIRAAYALPADIQAAEGFARSLLPNAALEKAIGREYRYFLSAVTCRGETRFDLPFDKDMTVSIQSASGATVSEALLRTSERARLSGRDSILFLSPVNPKTAEHLYLPDEGLFITRDRSLPARETVRLPGRAKKSPQGTDEVISTLLKSASRAMMNAKNLHDELESRYIPRMDFSKLVECESRVIEAFDHLEKKA